MKNSLKTAQKALQHFKEREPLRGQQQIGVAILTVHGCAAAEGGAFQAAFQKEMDRLKRIDGRKMNRFESWLRALEIKGSLIPGTILDSIGKCKQGHSPIIEDTR